MAKVQARKHEALDRYVGFRIYRERLRRGWSMRYLAEQADVHLNTIKNAERGDGISLHSLFGVARALDLSVLALLPKGQQVVPFTSGSPLFD